MDTLLTIHSHMRWIVLLVALVALIKTAISFIGKKDLGKLDWTLVRTHGWLITLQFLTGSIVLFGRWSDFGDGLRHRLEHAFLMIVAMTMVHLTARWRRTPSAVSTRNTLYMVLGSIILIVLAILILPQGPERLGLR
jgi:sterol desaturase/sphingolipid hydroxylase (fatty acid hydroxylase superfamily)